MAKRHNRGDSDSQGQKSRTFSDRKPVIDRSSEQHTYDTPWTNPVVYPKTGEDQVSLSFESFQKCVLEGCCFNDEIVLFYIRLLREKFRQNERSAHFFPSQFYENLSAPETCINYNGAKTSTKKEDIFERDYLVIPIHEPNHWYLAIVLYLSSIRVQKPQKVPTVVILDSLGRQHPKTIENIKRYLSLEAQVRKYTSVEEHSFGGLYARHAPRQDENSNDCAVYVCGYIEQFLENPDRFVRILLDESLKEEWPKINGSRIRNELGTLLTQLASEQRGEEVKGSQAKSGYSALELTKFGTPILPVYCEISDTETNNLVSTIQNIFEADKTVRDYGALLLDAPHLISPSNDIHLPPKHFDFEGTAQYVSSRKGKTTGILQISNSRAVLPDREPVFEPAKDHTPGEMEEPFEKAMKTAKKHLYFNIDVTSYPCRKGSYKLSCGQLLEGLSYSAGISTPYAYYSHDVSHFGAHVEDWHFASYNVVFAGAPKRWIAVKPSSKELFERRIREIFPRSGHCSQFVRHLGISVSPSLLREWNVDFHFIVQKAGQIVALSGYTYHWGMNDGRNYAEAVNFCMEKKWIVDANYQGCYHGCGIRGPPLSRPVPEVGTLIEKIARAHALAKSGTQNVGKARKRLSNDPITSAKRPRFTGNDSTGQRVRRVNVATETNPSSLLEELEDQNDRLARHGKSRSYNENLCGCVDQCTDQCSNRRQARECVVDNCSVGQTCGNRPYFELLQKLESQRARFEWTGKDLKAVEPLQPGQWIVEFTRDLKARQPNDTDCDADCKFVNHSHAPNCSIIKWLVSDQLHLILVASKPIMTGEQLTANYNLRYYTAFSEDKCKCGTTECQNHHHTPQSRFLMRKYEPQLDKLRAQAGTIARQSAPEDRVQKMREFIAKVNKDVACYAAASHEVIRAEIGAVLDGMTNKEKRAALQQFRKDGPLFEKLTSITRTILDKERFHEDVKKLPNWEFLSTHPLVKGMGCAALNDLRTLAISHSDSRADGLSLLKRALFEQIRESGGKTIQFQQLTAKTIRKAKDKAFRWAEPPGDRYGNLVLLIQDEEGIPSIAECRYHGINWSGTPWESPIQSVKTCSV
ncbi:hypothetical protein, variant 1 [Verruconis gallopava]|uniref:SET domain-containing protein n=1 Tax=Verruconis gallopava TaxID=253628 RepID=A0A0D1ZVS6_9PEZI|nr:hypothetical protein, variant 1 [Verruconis gallopava]KIV98542.1 hypothetical protein, variant 1 [Verruconis gallopava]